MNCLSKFNWHQHAVIIQRSRRTFYCIPIKSDRHHRCWARNQIDQINEHRMFAFGILLPLMQYFSIPYTQCFLFYHLQTNHIYPFHTHTHTPITAVDIFFSLHTFCVKYMHIFSLTFEQQYFNCSLRFF